MNNGLRLPVLDYIEPVEITTRKIGVWLFSQQPLFRLGLRQALNRAGNLQVIGDGDLHEKRLIMLELMPPDVVIVDLEPDASEGMDLIKRIRRSVPRASIITLSSCVESECEVKLCNKARDVSAGKNITSDRICELVRRVSANASFDDEPGASKAGAGEKHGLSPAPARITRQRGSRLSAREIEIMTAIANGYANKQIASRLGISERTVKNHITSIFKKLGVNARVEALLKAVKTGLVSLGGDYRDGNGTFQMS